MSRRGIPSHKYTKREWIIEFLKKNPGLDAKKISIYFGVDLRSSLYRLIKENKIYRVKENVWKYYAVKE
jgi:hypothetical protein